jgi:Domain of unknown function (DUF4136)
MTADFYSDQSSPHRETVFTERNAMKLKKQSIFVLGLLFAVLCGYGQDVHYNYDRGANFGAYKTYQWVDLPGRVSDQLIDQAVKRSIDEQLAQKGLTKVESGGDLQVGYQAGITIEKGVNLWGSGAGPGGWGWDDRTIQGQTSSIPVGVLLVNLYDPARKQLIWRGDASKTIDLQKDPDKNYKNLQKAMAKLFKNYPPKAGK